MQAINAKLFTRLATKNMEIKKISSLVILLASSIMMSGCTVPGSYMSSGDINSSTQTLEGRLTNTKLVSINYFLLQSDPEKFIRQNSNSTCPYYVGPNDVLSVVVWNHPELTVPTAQTALLNSTFANSPQNPFMVNPSEVNITVDANGELYFPYAKNIKVSGKTTNQIEKALANHLAAYIKNPQVSVRIATFNSQKINLVGEIQKPGVQMLTSKPMSLLDALNSAGGIETDTADARHIYVFRNDNNNISVYWLNVKNPQSLLLAERFRVINNDIVYVAPVKLVNWNRVMSQILPTIQTLWQTRSLLRD